MENKRARAIQKPLVVMRRSTTTCGIASVMQWFKCILPRPEWVLIDVGSAYVPLGQSCLLSLTYEHKSTNNAPSIQTFRRVVSNLQDYYDDDARAFTPRIATLIRHPSVIFP
jgi:hypothetical protein